MRTIITTELGLEQQCITCKEFFPYSREFFYGLSRFNKDGSRRLESNCKDCYKKRFKPETKGCYNVAYRYIGV